MNRRPRTVLAAVTGALTLVLVLGACGSSAQDQAESLAAALSAEAAAGQASAEAALSSAEQELSAVQESLADSSAPADTSSAGSADDQDTEAASSSARRTESVAATEESAATSDGAGDSGSVDGTDGATGSTDDSTDEAMDEAMKAMSPECQDTLSAFLTISPLLLTPITGGSLSQAEIDQAFADADGKLPADLTDDAEVIRQAAEDSIGTDMSTASDIVGSAKVTAAMDAFSAAVDTNCGSG